jgi:hypothetical protein
MSACLAPAGGQATGSAATRDMHGVAQRSRLVAVDRRRCGPGTILAQQDPRRWKTKSNAEKLAMLHLSRIVVVLFTFAGGEVFAATLAAEPKAGPRARAIPGLAAPDAFPRGGRVTGRFR